MNLKIQTDRLILRPFKLNDASSLNNITNQPYILKWMPDWNMSIESTKKLIQYYISKYPLSNKENARIMLAIELDGKLIGMVGIGNKEEVDNEIEIAYFISEDYSGNGYISEAVKALSKWSFESFKLDYLIAIVETDNYPSQRVIEKCGFQKIDTRMILNSGDNEEKPFYYYQLHSKNI